MDTLHVLVYLQCILWALYFHRSSVAQRCNRRLLTSRNFPTLALDMLCTLEVCTYVYMYTMLMSASALKFVQST